MLQNLVQKPFGAVFLRICEEILRCILFHNHAAVKEQDTVGYFAGWFGITYNTVKSE
jgi:hypothetical protein